jgi:hypothetical protein
MSQFSTDLPDHELMDLSAVCRFFGGTKPIHPATLYRGIHAGTKMGVNINRWVVSECQEARERMINGPRVLRQLSDRLRESLGRRRRGEG